MYFKLISIACAYIKDRLELWPRGKGKDTKLEALFSCCNLESPGSGLRLLIGCTAGCRGAADFDVIADGIAA